MKDSWAQWHPIDTNAHWDFLFISFLSLTKEHRWSELHLWAQSNYRMDKLLHNPHSQWAAYHDAGLFFLWHQTRFPLSRAVVIATHWLTGRSARSHWIWLTFYYWGSVTYYFLHCVLFLGTKVAHQLEFWVFQGTFFFLCGGSKSPGSSSVRKKHLISLDFIMWL